MRDIQIDMTSIPRSEAVEARIRELAGKLEQFHPRITSCRVAVEESTGTITRAGKSA
jgi:hypothetical protein